MKLNKLLELIQEGIDRDRVNDPSLSFQFELSKIHCVRMFGSRAYGSHTDKSDYDFQVVCKDFHVQGHYRRIEMMKFPVKHEKDYMIDTSFESDDGTVFNVGIHLMDTQYYLSMIYEHESTMLLGLYLPESCTWLEDDQLRYLRLVLFSRLSLQLRKLQRGFVRISEIAWNKSRRIFHKDYYKSMKNIAHAFRYLTYAYQIVTVGHLDIFEPNEKCKEIVSFQCTSWKEAEAKYEAEYRALIAKLKTYVKSSIEEKLQEQFQESSPHFLQYIQRFGLASLVRHFTINIVPFDLEHNIFYLIRDNRMSSTGVQICRECNGILLQIDDLLENEINNVRILCLPNNQFLYSVSEEATKQSIAYKYPLGSHFSLYYSQAAWKMVTDKQFDFWLNQLSETTNNEEQILWERWKLSGYSLPDSSDQDKTFTFISCEDGSIVLFSVRSTISYQQYSPNDFTKLYHWNGLHIFEQQDVQDLEQIINDPTTFKPTDYSGVVYLHSNSYEMHEMKSAIHLAIDELQVWDVALVRSSKDSIPFQGLESETNEFAIIKLFLNYRITREENSTDVAVFKARNPIFVDFYLHGKNKFFELCDFIDQTYLDIINSGKEDQFEDRRWFAKQVDVRFGTKLLKKARNALYMMWDYSNDHHQRTVHFYTDIIQSKHRKMAVDVRFIHQIWTSFKVHSEITQNKKKQSI